MFQEFVSCFQFFSFGKDPGLLVFTDTSVASLPFLPSLCVCVCVIEEFVGPTIYSLFSRAMKLALPSCFHKRFFFPFCFCLP